MKILVLSDFCVDIFPQSGKILSGGNALNLAVCCKRAGAEVFVMGNIGKDKYGAVLKKAMDKNGLNREKVYEVEGETARQIIHIDEKGDRYFKEGSWHGGVFDVFRIKENDKKFLISMDAVATTIGEPDFENIVFSLNRDKRPLFSVDFHDIALNRKNEKYFPYIDIFAVSGKKQETPVFHETLKK